MKKMRYFGKCMSMLLISIVFCCSNGCSFSLNTCDKCTCDKCVKHDKQKKNIVENNKKTKIKAEQGNARAQFILGRMYYLGQSVKQDYKEAFKWFDKSAQQGFARAQFALGRMYYLGRGVQQDYNKAINWIEKAAKQGDHIDKN